VTVGPGTLPVRAPRVNEKRVDEETGERERFSSKILPAYARRSPNVTEVLSILYLRGLSTGDFRPAPEGLLGEDASGPSGESIEFGMIGSGGAPRGSPSPPPRPRSGRGLLQRRPNLDDRLDRLGRGAIELTGSLEGHQRLA
jgi:hypothetical protein